MDIYILNQSFEKIGVIDTYSSIIWTKRYYTAGDFELYMPASQEILNLIQIDYYLQRVDDDSLMIVENIEIQTDAENGNFIIISGRSAESILARRIVWKQTNLNGTAENAIRKIINENFISPQDSKRKINNLVLGSANGFSETIEQQLTGSNVMAWLETVCKTYGYGWKVVLEKYKFVFKLYNGKNLTYGNSDGNNFVVFSPEFDNLINSNYKFNTQNYKNAALVLGEGEGTARARAELGAATDLNRYEIFVDARDLSTNNGEIAAAEYSNMLNERGKQKIAEQTTTTEFDGVIDTDGIYKYKQDYNLGDIVQTINEYGIAATSRIIEIIENEDENGRQIVPTFEEWRV